MMIVIKEGIRGIQHTHQDNSLKLGNLFLFHPYSISLSYRIVDKLQVTLQSTHRSVIHHFDMVHIQYKVLQGGQRNQCYIHSQSIEDVESPGHICTLPSPVQYVPSSHKTQVLVSVTYFFPDTHLHVSGVNVI